MNASKPAFLVKTVKIILKGGSVIEHSEIEMKYAVLSLIVLVKEYGGSFFHFTCEMPIDSIRFDTVVER